MASKTAAKSIADVLLDATEWRQGVGLVVVLVAAACA